LRPRVPAVLGRPNRVGRRLDVVRPGPGPMLFDGVATARSPALLGALAAAWIVLAGERRADILVRQRGHGQANRRSQVAEQDKPGRELLPQRAPEPSSSEPVHELDSVIARRTCPRRDCKLGMARSRVSVLLADRATAPGGARTLGSTAFDWGLRGNLRILG